MTATLATGRTGGDQPGTPTAGRTERKAPTALRSGALMAAGSLVSRATGFVRAAVVAAALGAGYVADGYAVGNSVPTIVYTLLLGGALNAVFVPELVKAAKEHADGGVAYTDRLLTLCALALTALTAAAVLAAPLIVDLYTDYSGAQRETTVVFARTCLPQILFLGLFTLLGQVLNARGRFGAMMWTPVLNNVVVVAVFGLFLVVSDGGTLTPGETALLGWGTTAGIALQALALVPALRAAGFRWRPRFDWRGSGLAAPLRSAGWLVLLVLTNQGAYWVTTLLATSAGGTVSGGGLAAYNNAYLLWTVPHGIVTVSLVTALLPRMSGAAADGDLAGVRRDVGYALRTSAAAVVPAACALFALAVPLLTVVFRYGATSADDIRAMSWILMAFAPGLVALSGQYVCTRAFYALRDTRTPFLLNLVIAGLGALLSLTAHHLLPTRWAVTGMAAGYSLALWTGWALTAYVLRRRLHTTGPRAAGPRTTDGPRTDPGTDPGPRTGDGSAVSLARLLLAAVPAAGYGLLVTGLTGPAGAVPSGLAGALTVLGTFAVLARPFRLTEVSALLTAGSGRLRVLARRR
ncbi:MULTISPECIES: murein biosynthesis integral membrane protein MurJ [unclassified Streptomyces]|uniref:murein biosynthesis integral membrane protein MurJ n=1 Tax=unclassified Streptomyces TaxID=2593676 RepID=UPI0016606385|nr:MULTISPECIES: murein biosynthesis integral membrane protein MurJ [unclassified Streptomyces]MBD0708006.1 murein biosynthesis integral membrane protein MurJ [Streptomyces sp. CBMA291]MBD0715900.1 murein biosynthesis integral membrane protein MurJ [Streptomyces sp. CBMA370]